MEITVAGLQGLFTALVGVGFEVVEVRDPDQNPPHGSAVHPGGEDALQKSIEVFESIASGSAKANTVPPNAAHVQVRGNCLTGSKRALMSPWLEIEHVQAFVRANQ